MNLTELAHVYIENTIIDPRFGGSLTSLFITYEERYPKPV